MSLLSAAFSAMIFAYSAALVVDGISLVSSAIYALPPAAASDPRFFISSVTVTMSTALLALYMSRMHEKIS